MRAGFRGNVHSSSIAHCKAHGRLPISANWTFLPALTVKALRTDIGRDFGRNCCVRKEWVGHFEHKFQGCGVAHLRLTVGARKLQSLSYHVALFALSYV